MKTVKENLLFRLEKFGGILINKTTFARIELNKLEACFLYAVRYCGLEKIIKYFEDNYQTQGLQNILEYDLFEENNGKDLVALPKDIIKHAEKKIEELSKKNILSFPLELTIYPSMYCDLSCSFCFLAEREEKSSKSAQDWRKILEQAKENGILSISILGGEPTRYYDIDNLLRVCDSLKLKTTITTNAQFIKKSTIKVIEQSSYITPVLSLQSLDEKLNFELMGVRPLRQVELIKHFKKIGKKCRINTVYTKQSLEQIKDLVDFCSENNVERFSVANYSEVTGFTRIKKKYDLFDLRKLNERISEYIDSQNYELVFATEGCHLFTAYPELIKDSIEFSKFDEMYFGCRAKYTKMEIMSNGDVLPCIAFLGSEQRKSNAFKSKLVDIWSNDKLYNDIRKFKTKNTRCLSCSLINICQGGCYVNLLREERPEEARDSVCTL